MGVDSCVPVGRPRDQTMRSCATLPLVICFSGLKRCSSYVRLMCSQSDGSGCASVASVTGTKPSFCAAPRIGIAHSAPIAEIAITSEDVFIVASRSGNEGKR